MGHRKKRESRATQNPGAVCGQDEVVLRLLLLSKQEVG